MALDLSKYLFIDGHAHSILARSLELDKYSFRLCFTESRSREQISGHVGESVSYRDMIRRVGKHFGGIEDEDEYILRRTGRLLSEFVRSLWDSVSITALIVDEGFTNDQMFSSARLAEVAQRRVYSCTRIETVIEDCIRYSDSFESLCSLFTQRLFVERYPQTVALKSIMGYRGGLSLLQVTEADASAEFANVKASFNGGNQRIEKSPLYHYLLLQALELAACNGLPVQFHTGLGDDDSNVVDCNPALLQPLLKMPTLQKTTFVLLHCYPYVREAASLAALYPNVYVDLSLSMTLVSAQAEQMLAELLSYAPPTKIIAGTDGHSSPESHWYGALVWKRALQNVLNDWIAKDLVGEAQAEEIAAHILHANAMRIYKLEGMP